MAKYINPYTDFGFKKLFGEEANKSPEQINGDEQSRLSYLEVKEAVNTAEMDGRKRAGFEVAKEMKNGGETSDKIKKYTGLTDSEIEKL